MTLADIPFVRLRSGLPKSLLDGKASYIQAVAAAQGHIGPPGLVIDFRGQRVEAAGHSVTLPPADLAFLAWFARRAQNGLDGLPCCPNPRLENGEASMPHAQAYLEEYQCIVGPMADDERTRQRYRQGMSKADFEERKSKLKSALSTALGAAAQPYLIQGQGRRPMRYRLSLPSGAIRFVT